MKSSSVLSTSAGVLVLVVCLMFYGGGLFTAWGSQQDWGGGSVPSPADLFGPLLIGAAAVAVALTAGVWLLHFSRVMTMSVALAGAAGIALVGVFSLS